MSKQGFVYEFRTRRIRRSRAADGLNSIVFNPKTVATIARRILAGDARENMMVFCLDTRNQLVGFEIVAIGTLTGVDVHPREVFRTAILSSCAAIVMVHNHPSGDCAPSEEDWALTYRMRNAGDLLGIPVLDHVVVTETEHRSLVEELEP